MESSELSWSYGKLWLTASPALVAGADIKGVGIPVIPDMENISARHFKDRSTLPCHRGELLGRHVFGNLFYVTACQPDTIPCNMVTDFLLRVFQHHLVSSSHAVVIDHGKILVFRQQVITLVLEWGNKGILLVDPIVIIILLGKPEQSLIIAFLPKRIQS